MNNINQEKEKLLKLLQELEKEYLAENISEEEYNSLSKEYQDKLSNITAVDRIRAMQGKKTVSRSKKQIAEKNKVEDEKLVDKYIVKTEKEKKESSTNRKRIYAAIAIFCIFTAFIAGIGFGIFNFDFQSSNPVNAVVTVNESAFPVVTSNNTNNTNKTEQKNTTINNSENTNTKPKPNINTNTNTNKDSNKNNKDPSKTNSRTKPNK
ncbi:MAG: hypothetical protein LBU74_04945 [Methanobacteriaceae archaeon]|nr:hypothetical protein [Candidatus Methanorudis spinitermitis]